MSESEEKKESAETEEMIEEKKKLIKEKLDPLLTDIVNANPAIIPIIIQTIDGLKPQDREIVEKLGGKVKDDLYIINAFSAEMSSDALVELLKSPRIVKVYYDAEVRAI